MQNLQQKEFNIIICQRCCFFPTHNQLPHYIQDSNVYQVVWVCPICDYSNITPTDQNFSWYCNFTQTINETTLPEQNALVFIECSLEMKEQHVIVPSRSYNKLGTQLNKQVMCEESPLMRKYLETVAARERIRRGRGFSWKDFLKSRSISKFQYGLWLTDFIRKQFSRVSVTFYSPEPQKNQSPNKQFYQNRNLEEIDNSFFRQLNNQQFRNVPFISSLGPFVSQNDSILIIGDQDPEFLKNAPLQNKIFFRKVADQLDPITLKKAQFKPLASWGVNVQLYFKRAEDYQKSQKSYTTEMMTNFCHLKNEVAVFLRKPNLSQGSSMGQWEKSVPKIAYSCRVQMPKQQKESSFIFQIDRNKLMNSIADCLNLAYSKRVDRGLLMEIIKILSSLVRLGQTRAYLKLFNQQQNKSYILLWSSRKPKASQMDRQRVQNYFDLFSQLEAISENPRKSVNFTELDFHNCICERFEFKNYDSDNYL